MIALLLVLAGLAFADSAFSTVTLTDGQTITGLVTQQADGSVTVVIGGGNVVVVPASAVRSVRASSGDTITTPRTVEVGPPVPEAPPETAAPVGTPAPVDPAPTDAPAPPADAPTVPTAAAAAPAPTSPGPLPLPGEPGPDAGTSPHGWPSDPNRVGYFYSPSAFMLGQGRGYVAQKELAITAAAFGITDFWDVQVGTVVPLLFTETRVGIAGTKVAFRITKGLRAGAGVQAFFLGGDVGLIPFGVVTVGSEDRHLSANVGYLRLVNRGTAPIGLVTLSGNYRLGPKSALITENWFVVSDVFNNGLFVVPTAGVRLFGPHFAVDLGAGVIAASGTVIPLPWVGFTWNWGLPGTTIPEIR